MFSPELLALAQTVLDAARKSSMKIATAESCTGGLIAGLLTEIPGSSDVVDRGFVTYSNEAKETMLSVPSALLKAHGAVSEPVARAMAQGALVNSLAQIAIAVTGIAGPGGGTDAKPVGLVYIATMRDGREAMARKFRFGAIGRDAVRLKTVEESLKILLLVIPGEHEASASCEGRKPR